MPHGRTGTTSLRRAYRRARRKARFNFAVLFTIVVVAYVAVPHVANLVQSFGGYNPGHYEPKDSEREAALQQRAEGAEDGLPQIPWNTVFNVALFLMVAVVWLTLVPSRSMRRPPRR